MRNHADALAGEKPGQQMEPTSVLEVNGCLNSLLLSGAQATIPQRLERQMKRKMVC